MPCDDIRNLIERQPKLCESSICTKSIQKKNQYGILTLKKSWTNSLYRGLENRKIEGKEQMSGSLQWKTVNHIWSCRWKFASITSQENSQSVEVTY